MVVEQLVSNRAYQLGGFPHEVGIRDAHAGNRLGHGRSPSLAFVLNTVILGRVRWARPCPAGQLSHRYGPLEATDGKGRGVLVFDGAQLLDVSGPVDVLPPPPPALAVPTTTSR